MNTNYYFLPGNVVADLNIKLLAASLSNKVDFLLIELADIDIVSTAKKLDANEDRKSTRLNSSHIEESRMPSSA